MSLTADGAGSQPGITGGESIPWRDLCSGDVVLEYNRCWLVDRVGDIITLTDTLGAHYPLTLHIGDILPGVNATRLTRGLATLVVKTMRDAGLHPEVIG